MSSIWLKVLTAIDLRNEILQVRNATLNVEVENTQSLMEDLGKLREKWDVILTEYKQVAKNLEVEVSFDAKRRKIPKRFVNNNAASNYQDEITSSENVFKTLFL